MRPSIQVLATMICGQFWPPWAGAVEFRTYDFTADESLPYSVSCGECGPPFLGARADIDGTFTVALDPAAGTGTLLALNDRLVNVFDHLLSPTGPKFEPADPLEWQVGIIPPWTPNYHPPLEGVLSVDGDVLRLISDGSRPIAGGTSVVIVPSYTITMQGDQATLSMDVPIMDWYITVDDVRAQLVHATSSPGDYNGNGTVDAADYVVWRKNLETAAVLPNDISVGSVTAEDYGMWRAQFGRSTNGAALLSSPMNSAVPEPSTLSIILIATFATLLRQRGFNS
jgi:hypothetical protein